MPIANQVRQTIPELRFGSRLKACDHLSRTAFPFALAVAFEDNDEHLEYEAMLSRVATSLPRLIGQRHNERLDIIVEALLPDIKVSVLKATHPSSDRCEHHSPLAC
jgi:hypothetical protein